MSAATLWITAIVVIIVGFGVLSAGSWLLDKLFTASNDGKDQRISNRIDAPYTHRANRKGGHN